MTTYEELKAKYNAIMGKSHETVLPVNTVDEKPGSPWLTVNVAKEFSPYPGGREGPFSGREFRETLLEPRFKLAKEKKQKLLINLDGAEGYATSFLKEAFGSLAAQYGTQEVLGRLELQCLDEPLLVNEIEKYIREAV